MNGSWKNCVQRHVVTSANWREWKCARQGTVFSVPGRRDQAVLPLPETPPPHSREDAFLKEQLFPHWFLRELTQLFILAEQVSKAFREGSLFVSVVFSMVLWLQ